MCGGAQLLWQERHGDVFAADGLVVAYHLVDVSLHLGQGNMSRDGHKTQRVAPELHLLWGVAVKAGQFKTVITHILDSGQRPHKILCEIVAQAVDLNRNGDILLFGSAFAGEKNSTEKCNRN